MFVQPFDPFPRPAEQPSPTATRRLQRDFQRLLSEPIDGIIAMPNEENILEWHYVIKGSPDTPYEGEDQFSVGLHSFMNEETYAAGVLNESNTVRRKYANDSIAWNLACPEFKKMFPTMFEELAHENGVGSSTPFSNRRTVTASEVASTSVDHRSALSQRSAKKRRADTNVEENSVRPHLQPQMRKVEVIELSDGE
ncbi:ubiquitin--protein ligase [Ancylostoma ceylanicum]|uniref:Ubiquitin--protein ligase n=1 Tax=Ancylostoma ceylanicum TaxID=53326 RepID=A0A0D6MCL4_9BILA|nr:ubiquitin--protein ligase [Ancylostoma ceylanicum]